MADEDRVEEISSDLPYELQSKMFDQLAAMALAGTGLVITLAGSLLQGVGLVWIAAVEFGLAAVIALSGQQQLIEGLFNRTPVRKKSRISTVTVILLIGMGSGSLATSVYMDGKVAARGTKAPEQADSRSR